MAVQPGVLPQERTRQISGSSRRTQVWQRFRRRPLGVAGLIVLSLILLGVILLPAVLPFDMEHIDVENHLIMSFAPFGAPSPTGYVHWLGTDREGRDLAVRVFGAGRATLSLAFVAALFTMLIGVSIGVIAGFYGGWVDSLSMRAADFLLAVPAIPLYLLANRVLESTGAYRVITSLTNNNQFLNTMSVIVLLFTILGWAGVARQIRVATLKIRALSFVEATQALGASNRRIVLKHLLPNSAATILTAGTLLVAEFIVLESALSYMGMGVGKAAPSWGFMLIDATSTIWSINNLNPFDTTRPYTTILPTLLIFLTVLSINFIGDTLRRALDPKAG